jgi:hypothetical protein
MDIPSEICDNILSNYLTIYENKNINRNVENFRRNKIKKSINKINKLIYNHIVSLRKDMDIEYYDLPKYYYKKYYPMCERKGMIILAMNKVNLVNHNEVKKIFDIYNNDITNKISLVDTFNKIIDLINIDELNYIGW